MAEPHPFGHEAPQWNTRAVLKIGAVLFGFVVVALIILYFTVMHGPLAHRTTVVQRADRVPPPPRLQPHPAADIHRLRMHKHEALRTYGWDGPAHHFAHIPIERAMQLYVQQHERDDALAHASSNKGTQP